MKLKAVFECYGPNEYVYLDHPCSISSSFEAAVEITVSMEKNNIGFYPKLNFSVPELPAAWGEGAAENSYCCPICREILEVQALKEKKRTENYYRNEKRKARLAKEKKEKK